MRPPDHDNKLGKARNDRCYRSAFDSHSRESELAENENVVEYKIYHDRCAGAYHRNDGLPGFLQRSSVTLRYGIGHKPNKHDRQIIKPFGQRQLEVKITAALVQEQAYKRSTPNGEYYNADNAGDYNKKELKAHYMPEPVLVTASAELCAKDTGARKTAENQQVEHKDKLVCNRNAAHLFGAHAPYHQIVKDCYKLGNTALNHYRHRHGEDHAVKVLVPYKLFEFHYHMLPLVTYY